ncbi:hypothetical protein AMS68_002889 [Peltaster fructicola]|uniref:PHD-type domain-containing protein n=1 Tax=Peltaster fructicola TaxID=286661 RepID=A0A6H0XRI1_9PEZI|nr:hypothetical protein AMS68_002889 [Peltaster fructicola]
MSSSIIFRPQSSISTISVETPTSTLRARFGLRNKSSRQSLSGSVNGTDDAVSPKPADDNRLSESVLERVSAGQVRPEVPVVTPRITHVSLRADRPLVQTNDGNNAFAQCPMAAPKTVSQAEGHLERIRESPNSNLTAKNTKSVGTIVDRSDRIASAELNTRRLSHPQIGTRQTVSANISARRSFLPDGNNHSRRWTTASLPLKAHHALIPSSSVRPPPSSPSTSSTGTQKARPCHGCNDAGAYRMKQFMAQCTTCWRRYHPDCIKWQPKELALLRQRKLPDVVGEPGWVCRVCLQKNRRPTSSRPPQLSQTPLKKITPVKKDGSIAPTASTNDGLRRVSSDTTHLPEESVIPSIEPASSYDGSHESSTNKLKRKHSSSSSHSPRLTKKPGKQQGLYRPNMLLATETHAEPAVTLISAATTTPEQCRKEPTANSTTIVQVTGTVAFVRAPTEALLAEAIGDTLKEPYDIASTQEPSSIAAKLLDQREREEMLPNIDTSLANATDDNQVSSSDKQNQGHASLPSPDDLASDDGKLSSLNDKPSPLSSAKRNFQRLPHLTGNEAPTQPKTPGIHDVPTSEPVAAPARNDSLTPQTGSTRQGQSRPASILGSTLLTCHRVVLDNEAGKMHVTTDYRKDRPHVRDNQRGLLSRPSKPRKLQDNRLASPTATSAEEAGRVQVTVERQIGQPSTDFQKGAVLSHAPTVHKQQTQPGASLTTAPASTVEQLKAATFRQDDRSKVDEKRNSVLSQPSAANGLQDSSRAPSATMPADVPAKQVGALPRPSATRKLQDNRRTTSMTTPTYVAPNQTSHTDVREIPRSLPDTSPTTIPTAIAPAKLSLAELQHEFGQTHEHTEDHLVKLITQALYSTPGHGNEMLHREITQWIVDNVATYQKDSSWEGRVGKVLAAHSATAGEGSRKLWDRSKRWIGDAHPWKLLNPADVKQRWDSSLRRYVSTSGRCPPPPPGPALTPRKITTYITNATPVRTISYTPPVAVMVTPPPVSSHVATCSLLGAMTGIDSDTSTALDGTAGSEEQVVYKERSAESEKQVVHKERPAESDKHPVHDEAPPAVVRTKVNPKLTRLIEHALTKYTMDCDSLPSQIRPFSQATESARFARIATRRTRKQMFGHPASESRLKRSGSFVPGLGAESTTASSIVAPGSTIYNTDPFAGAQLNSHGERVEAQFQDYDDLDKFFDAPRDMIMTISEGDLAWRDMPHPGGGVRTRPKMIGKVGKSS